MRRCRERQRTDESEIDRVVVDEGGHRASRAWRWPVETVQEVVLLEELRRRGLSVERQVSIPIV